MNGLNGIIHDGKVYEVVIKEKGNPCIDCELQTKCDEDNLLSMCHFFDSRAHFRFSQSLTDKINGK